mmetsp:Transcript_41861/g.80018  ORF Transcript_41861/g.80018 Transcript_41861/m.80018 type:complete len:252 (+) Transcript_41861:2058-2813(+)
MHCELASTSDTREGKRVRLGPVEARLEPLADWEAPEEDREERCAAVAAIWAPDPGLSCCCCCCCCCSCCFCCFCCACCCRISAFEASPAGCGEAASLELPRELLRDNVPRDEPPSPRVAEMLDSALEPLATPGAARGGMACAAEAASCWAGRWLWWWSSAGGPGLRVDRAELSDWSFPPASLAPPSSEELLKRLLSPGDVARVIGRPQLLAHPKSWPQQGTSALLSLVSSSRHVSQRTRRLRHNGWWRVAF